MPDVQGRSERATHATHTYTERTDLMIDDHEHHNPGCQGGVLKTRIETDNVRIRCRACGAYWFVPHDETPDLDNDVDTPIITTRLVCREHHDQPVTARGKGCTVCRAAAQTWRDRRRRGRRVVVE